MAGLTAFNTGLSGLNVNSRRLDMIGNNIANVNTLGYKSSRMLVSSSVTPTFSLGTAPTGLSGGTNPMQVGLGTAVSAIQRDHSVGAIATTGVTTDVAIEGDGFFIVDRAGDRQYTRAGAFQLDSLNNLVAPNGSSVLGYGVDGEFALVQADLIPLNLPVGTLTVAEATQNVIFSGNLNSSGEIGTTGSIFETAAFYLDSGLTTLADETADVTTTDLYIDDGTGTGTLAFASADPGPLVTIDGIEKGGKDIGTRTFEFTSGASTADGSGQTLQDYMDWLDEVLGLHDTAISGFQLGGGVTMSSGQIVVNGNIGTAQELSIESSDITVTNNGAGSSAPFVFTQTGEADGESVRTSFVSYDSLGTPVTVDLTFVLMETTAGEGSEWFFIAESNDNATSDRVVGTGVMEFDANGRFLDATSQSFQLRRDNGAVDPLVVDMDFLSSENLSALTDTQSELSAVYQDGSPIGTLTSFSIGSDGVINGSFSNGLTRNLGQIALAKFTNPQGLDDTGGGYYRVGPNSGTPIITSPLAFGTGRLIGGALEQSNVDLSREFTDMILASMGYSASGRVISTADELVDQLLLLGR